MHVVAGRSLAEEEGRGGRGDEQHQATHVPPFMHSQPPQGPDVAGKTSPSSFQLLPLMSTLVPYIPILLKTQLFFIVRDSLKLPLHDWSWGHKVGPDASKKKKKKNYCQVLRYCSLESIGVARDSLRPPLTPMGS
uniref:Uncharacterized protein n=1 Tax=Molossus molossus TaxID=27622 RepID=A0A7J8DTD0_MOLMO|nr:hypothetical protein HJG59_009174 [Molossus molossus]